ncbi:MAG: RluA family pseudouridine synthase, partial [Lachnospiraceae bacterium]|nr:RluA family pseudouridine synthase [Lachnospiraceae bacterium]
MPQYKFIIEDESDGERLDKLLSELMPDCSRTFIQKLIKDGAVTKNGTVITKASQRPEAGDELVFSIPEPVVPEIIPEDIPIDIVYEDSDILIVNKQKGMVVHPAPGHLSGTLVNAILFHCKDLSGINGILRPGIVHRIDKDTSGLLIICKNDNSHRKIAAQLKDHSIERTYHAIVHGRFNEEFGTVDANIGRSSNDRKKMAVVDRLSGKTAI